MKIVKGPKQIFIPFTLQIVIPFLIPCIPIIVSCFLSIAAMSFRAPTHPLRNRPKRVSGGITFGKLSKKRKDTATKTILMLTGIYIIFNIPYWIYVIINILYISRVIDVGLWLTKQNGSYFVLFVTPVSIIINCGVNPFLYFFRIQSLRVQIVKNSTKLKQLRSSLRGRKHKYGSEFYDSRKGNHTSYVKLELHNVEPELPKEKQLAYSDDSQDNMYYSDEMANGKTITLINAKTKDEAV